MVEAAPRYLVAQICARRSYAVASVLESEGMLTALYTDICADRGIGRAIVPAGRILKWKLLKKLQGRAIPANIRRKTRSFDWPAVRYEIERRFVGADPYRQANLLKRFGEQTGQAMGRAGFRDATHLYTMLGEVTPLLEKAKRAGLTTVTEIYVILTGELIVARERRRFPGFETDLPADLLKEAFAWLHKVCSLSDWFVTPSTAVRQDLCDHFGVSPERCLLVPYAASDEWYRLRNRPVPGRILFAGTAGMRKGIHILGAAATRLSHRPYEYRIAGDVTETVRKHPLTQRLIFLGRVPRDEMIREYQQADVMVLPSLAEGSAEATYEAMAAGVPVITTDAAGSVVRNGTDGFIVPVSDEETLADRIERIVEDRPLRERMAAAARERAKEYTWAKYQSRLVEALAGISADHLIRAK